jgi:hypothetical protein
MVAVVVVGLMCVSALARPVSVKTVGAGAEDIVNGVVVLPDVEATGVSSGSALVRIEQAYEDGRWVWREGFDAGVMGVRVAILAEGDVEARLVSDAGRVVRIGGDAAAREVGVTRSRSALAWGDLDRVFDGVRVETRGGMWTLEVSSATKRAGYALIDTGSGALMRTHEGALGAVVGDEVRLLSSFTDGFEAMDVRAFVRGPDGTEREVVAEPGAADVSFVGEEAGTYAVRVVARGVMRDGTRGVLSTQHAVVVDRPVRALGDVRAEVDDDAVTVRFDGDDRRVVLAAQVWGVRGGVEVPVCFVARVCEGERSLVIDRGWVDLAGVEEGSLELREVRVHDAGSMRPVLVVDRVALEARVAVRAARSVGVTDAMRFGARPMVVESDGAGSVGAGVGVSGHRLLLVHGYCSGGNPFPVGQFDGDVAVFSDPESNRSHDAFALEILAQTATLKSFGVAAHSQGAMAALQLYTFYFSPMDWARDGNRLIQSVGAPYQGTALAGNAAVLGDIFGFGCGVNDDMTYGGSASWLSLIPSWARDDVWYWTTSFEDRPFAYDFCNFVTDLLLDDPDDGVIERSAGQLVGATNMGHLEGWCHTTGMRDPAQCTDADRNAQIDAEAPG